MGVPEGAVVSVSARGLCADLSQSGGYTRVCQEAEPFEYVTSWDAAVVKPGNWSMPAKPSGDIWPWATGHIMSSLTFLYLPLFKQIHISCVFYIVCDFLELGVPLPPLPGVKFSFCINGSGPKTLLTLEGDFYNKCIN